MVRYRTVPSTWQRLCKGHVLTRFEKAELLPWLGQHRRRYSPLLGRSSTLTQPWKQPLVKIFLNTVTLEGKDALLKFLQIISVRLEAKMIISFPKIKLYFFNSVWYLVFEKL
jgi:hypothetical protein